MNKMYQNAVIVGTVDPDVNTTGDVATDWIDTAKFRKVMFLVMAGTIASSGTLDFKVQQATSATGAGAATLASGTYNITQMDTGDNDTQAVVEVDSSALTATFRYIRGVLTLTTAAADSAVVAIGGNPFHLPATDNDLASVAEYKG